MKAKIVKDKISFEKSLKLIPESNKERLQLLSIFNDGDNNTETIVSLRNGKLEDIVIYKASEI
jgi:hypothetical protein